MPRRKRVNLKDVAGKAGVSVNTASDILNGGDCRYRPETRRRVAEIARRLGYRPHRQAQAIRTGRSGLLGLLVRTGLLQPEIERSHYAAEAVRRHGYQMLVHDMILLEDDFHAGCQRMLDAHVEGLIVGAWASDFGREESGLLRAAGIPLVMLGAPYHPDAPLVYCDMRQALREVAEHLLKLGHRQLILMTPAGYNLRLRNWRRQQRCQGFIDAIRGAGGRVFETQGLPGARRRPGRPAGAAITGEIFRQPTPPVLFDPYQPGRLAMRALLARPHPPRAVLCANDDWALGALGVCAAAGLRVPEEIAITGFDNASFGAALYPPLTTVAQPSEGLARAAVDLLVRQIRGESLTAEESKVKLPCRLVVRRSCGAAGGAGRPPAAAAGSRVMSI